MPKRDWFIHFAIGLIVIALTCIWAAFHIGSEIGKTRGESNKHSAMYERHAEEQIRSTCLTGQSEDIAECVAKVIGSTNEQRRAQNDLVAQMEMARWAFYMLVATIVVAIITGAGVYYVWRTLEVTRETGRDQVRAYVEVSNVKFFWGTPEGAEPQLKVVLKNHGGTPAKWFQIRQCYSVFEHGKGDPVPSRFDDLHLHEEFGPVWNGINPKEDGMQTQGPEVFADSVKNCWRDKPRAKGMPLDNTHGILVYGEIRYCTIFNEIYRSQFLFGSGSLECFESEGSVEHERYIEGSITYFAKTTFEKPQKLTRIPTRLALYQRES